MMTFLPKLAAVALVAGTMIAAATPAQAVITTFASYSPIGQGSNIYWRNSGSSATNGTGGSIDTISTASATTPGARLVSFSFLQPALVPYVSGVTAKFTLNAAAPAGNPALLLAGFLIQPGVSGSFSFLTTAPIVIGSTTFATGSNLLSATFGMTALSGQRNGSTAAFGGSVAGGSTLVFTSDFLSFTNTNDRDFQISLTSVTPGLQATPLAGTPNKALRTFKAVSGGSFATDPAPLVTAIPEPAMWGLMVVGFGMVGLRTRRRTNGATVAA